MANDLDLVPGVNRAVQSTASKGENISYSSSVGVLDTLNGPDGASVSEVQEQQLARLMQHGHISTATVPALLKSLKIQPGKDGRQQYTRALYYLVQLALGDGSAGTPVPMPPGKANGVLLAKAVDHYGPDVLSAAWADLGDENTPFVRKQGAMRALAALTHASLTSKPDDPTYPAGMFMTLQALLDRIDELRAGRQSLSSMLATATNKKKNLVADFKRQMECWGLLHMALVAARVALSRSGLGQIATRSFAGVSSSDAVCARHALALANLAARDPQAAGEYVAHVGPLLMRNVELGKRTGVVFSGGKQNAAGSDAPAVMREEAGSLLNLKDTWSRVYLARGCAASIQSGYVGGNIKGNTGMVFWGALELMALGDPSELVGLEATRAMFGAPAPHAESLRKRVPSLEAFDGSEGFGQAKTYGSSWHMIMSVADEAPMVVPKEAHPPCHPAILHAATAGPAQPSAMTISLFSLVASRVLYAMQARSRSLIVAGCRTAAVICEARAWCTTLNGGSVVESEGVKRIVRCLQNVLVAVLNSELLGSVERGTAAEGLLWLQITAPEDPRQSVLPPAMLLRAASQGGLCSQPVVRALWADPWPEPQVASLLSAIGRRMRATPSLAPWACELAGALAAAAPGSCSRDLLLGLWDAAPGPCAARCALGLLGSPLPPCTSPPVTAAVEIKALAAKEEAAWEGLRAAAAWWLGEHINAVAGCCAWKPPAKASVVLPFLVASTAGAGFTASDEIGGVASLEPLERLALAAATHAPLLSAAMSQLQRHLMTGGWEARVACAQALAKLAVRSPEPFRIQGYAMLQASMQGPAPQIVAGATAQPASLAGSCDPLGLAPIVQPALELLDAMYAGQLVLTSQCNKHGATPATWPPEALAAVRRRHEWLMGALAQRVGPLPKDVFWPLGPRSRALLAPDEEAAEEPVEEDTDAEALNRAAAKAEEYGDDYGEEYEDGEYQYEEEYEGQATGPHGEDLLARWQAGEYDAQGFKLAKVEWKGTGDRDDAASTVTSGDDEEARVGTVLYAFTPDSEEEVAVHVGERVRVHVDMGDWLHITNAAGAQGLVPSSYVRMQDAGARQERAASYVWTPDAASMGYGAPAVQGLLEQSGYADMDDGGEGYAAYGYGDGEGAEPKQGFGGFDDFGSALAAAAEERTQAQARAAQAAAERLANSQRRLSSSSTSSNVSTLNKQASVAPAAGLQSTISGASSVQGAQLTAPVPSGSGGGAAEPGWAAFDDSESAFPAPAAVVDAPASVPVQVPVPAAKEPVVPQVPEPALQPEASISGVAAGEHGAELGGQESVEEAQQPATVLYPFQAEMDGELTISEGDVLVVMGEEENGWLSVVRPADGSSGLVPVGYVQLL